MARVLIGIALVASLVYAALCGLLYVRQRSLIYYPQFTQAAPASTDFALERDGVRLRGWIVNAGGRDPILYFGGNAESIEANRGDFARWFPRRAVYLLAYRGYGASEGAPSEAALTADALALYDRVRAAHPGQPIAAIGRSLGSGVASHVAAQRPVARLVLVTPFDSLAAVAQSHYPMFPARWLLKDRYESARRLARYEAPVLVLRAGRDRVVPPANTDALIAALPRPPRVVAIPDAGHDSISEDPAYAEALQAFLR